MYCSLTDGVFFIKIIETAKEQLIRQLIWYQTLYTLKAIILCNFQILFVNAKAVSRPGVQMFSMFQFMEHPLSSVGGGGGVQNAKNNVPLLRTAEESGCSLKSTCLSIKSALFLALLLAVLCM